MVENWYCKSCFVMSAIECKSMATPKEMEASHARVAPNCTARHLTRRLTANEKATINTVTGDREVSVEPFTSYSVARVQQDFNQSNTLLGGIFTSTNRTLSDPALNFLNRAATTGGLDLKHFWHDIFKLINVF